MNYTNGHLNTLASRYGTDKASNHHDYCKYYEPYIAPFINHNITLIEIGVGGDEDELVGGHSLRMWHDFLPKAKIVGVDLHRKLGIMNERTKFYQISQDDEKSLQGMVKSEGTPSVIIDDASHINPLTIKTFEIMFPLLASGGIYIVEDLETSYWTDNGYKGALNPKDDKTIMNFLKSLTDAPNSHCFDSKFHDAYSGKIEFVHFFKQTCIIKKL